MKKIPYRSTPATRREAKRLIAYFDGEAGLPKGTTVRWVLPTREIKWVRTQVLKMTQQAFADLLRKELITVQSWEQGLRVPDATATTLIVLLGKHKQLRNWLEKDLAGRKDRVRAAA